MKKFFAVILLLIMTINTLPANAVQEIYPIESPAIETTEAEHCKFKEITDQGTILEIANKENFENADDIIKIVYCYFDEPDIISINSSVSPCYFGNDYYVKSNTIREYEERGKLLRSSKYASPGGSMTIKQSIKVTVNVDANVDYEIISASLGFDVEASYEVSETQNVKVPSGKTYTVRAYVNNLVNEFEIWENDIFEDDFVEDASVVKPIGVIFTISKN